MPQSPLLDGASCPPRGSRPSYALHGTGARKSVLSDEWLKKRKDDSDVAGATWDGNASHFEVHIWPAFGDVPVASFANTTTQAKLGEWIRKLKAQKGEQGRQTVRNIVASFRTFFDYVVSPEGKALLPANPLRAQWIANLLPKHKKTDARFATLDDAPFKPETIQAVLNNSRVALQWRARIALAFTSPARDGEIAGLQIKDVHFDAAIPFIDIHQSCVLNHRDGFAKIGKVKKEWSNRKLPLHPAASAGLRHWIDEGWEEFVGRPPEPIDPVFPRDDGNFGRPVSASFLREALALCGLPTELDGKNLHFHDARGCVATWLKNANVSDSLIRRFLGHAPIGAAETRYFKGNLLAALVEAHKVIALTWSKH